MAASRTGSILTVDFGNVTTRALLLDVVEGGYQLIAQTETRTTAEFPAGDVTVGMNRALNDLSILTGRTLLDTNDRLITPETTERAGVDTLLTTASIGRPLRTVLIGLVPAVSIASGLRAIAGTYIDIVETISLDDTRSEEAQINAIVLSRPDLIFMVGGTEDGAREPVLNQARRVLLALMLMQTQRKPAVLFAGNSDIAPEVQAMFGRLTTLFVAPNVRPSLEEEEIEGSQFRLAQAFNALSTRRGAGFEKVSEMSPFGVLPTAQSYGLLVDYLGQARDDGVLAVDVGSATSTLTGSFERQTGTTIRTDIGLGHSARDLLGAVGADAIRQWLPFTITDDALNNYAWNKALRPGGVPENIREFYLEYAFLRAGLRALVAATSPLFDSSLADTVEQTLPPCGLMIGGGAALTNTGVPALTALLLLDGLQPSGVTDLQSDPYALVPALGAVARVNPAAVVQLLASTAVQRLGTVFNLSGDPRPDRPAFEVRINRRVGEPVRHTVAGGELWVYPLEDHETVDVDVRVAGRGLSINGGRRVRRQVSGGLVGLIFDARGRPLALADAVGARSAQLTGWLAQMTGITHTIPEEWLQTAPTAAPTAAPADSRRQPDLLPGADASDEPEPKRGLFGRRRRKAEPAARQQEEQEELDELRDLFS